MSRFHPALAGVFATAVAAAGLVGAATPAGAATSATCVYAESTRLLTANDGTYKVWIDPTTTPEGLTEYTVCFGAASAVRGAIVVRTPVGGTLVPTVSPDADDDACPRLLHVQDPIDLMTRFRQTLSSNPGYVCFGVADAAVRLTLVQPSPVVSPNVEVFFDPQTTAWTAYCAQFPAAADCVAQAPLRINVV